MAITREIDRHQRTGHPATNNRNIRHFSQVRSELFSP